ncbi:hypothetical protein [Enhygromyxa salina]|uniref:Tetratricopeptide repeat protein n=1 Tax=Enhygromyxa salina TaxID=215803 RepID=A0A2S9XTX4_9BACT|nr:hypothetical protein [Enhygromyxa salina]PRP96328.1 hypothetical protein ENSA7_71430 [Enhygromyxa salina]
MPVPQPLLDALTKRREAADLLQRNLPTEAILALREAAESLDTPDPDSTRTEALAESLDALSNLLRTEGRVAEALDPAERALRLITTLARNDPPRYLPLLTRATDNLGRCYQQLRQFERAAAAYEQATAGYAILIDLPGSTAPEHLQLAEVMSRHALALAQIGELERAYTVATAFVERGRELLPRSLPLLAGGLLFLADLAEDLGRQHERIAHLTDGVQLLERAAQDELPGAREAASRMATALHNATNY